MLRRAFSFLAIFAEASYYVKGAVPRGTFRSVPITLPVVGDPVLVRPRGTYKPLTVNPALPPLSLDTWVPVEYYKPHGYIYVNQEDGNEYAFVDNATRPVIRRHDRMVPPYEPREAREPEIFDFMDPIDPAFSQPIMDTIHQSPDIRLGSADTDAEDEEVPRRTNLRGMVDGLAALPVQLLKDAISIPQHFAELFRHGLNTESLADCNSLVNPLCISANVWATFATAARVDGSLDVFNLANANSSQNKPFLAAVTEALTDRLGEFRASQPVVGVVADAESEEVVAVYQPDCRVDKLVQIPRQVAERLLDAIDKGRQVIVKETENVAHSINRKDLLKVLVEPLDYLSKQIKHLAKDRLPEEALEDTLATVNAGAEKVEIAFTKVIDQLTAFPQAVIEKVKEVKEELHSRVVDVVHEEEEEDCGERVEEEIEEVPVTEEAHVGHLNIDAALEIEVGADVEIEAGVKEVKEVQAADKIEPLKPIDKPLKPIDKPIKPVQPIQTMVPLVKLDKPVQTSQPIEPIQPLAKVEQPAPPVRPAVPAKPTAPRKTDTATSRPVRLWDNGFLFGSGTTTELLRDTADQLMSVIPRTFNIAPATQPLDIIMRPFFNTLASI